METFQSGMPGGLKNYWLNGDGAAKVGWGTKGSFTRCVGYLREYVGEDAEGTCANLYHEATGEWPGRRKKASAALAPIEFRYEPSELADVVDLVLDGHPVAVPRNVAARIVEAIGEPEEPVDLTLITVEDSRFFALAATNMLARSDMPQIPTEMLDEFRRSIGERGVLSWKEDVDPRQLFATQNELDARKVGYMIGQIRSGEMSALDVPLVAAIDGRILDGHHRWAAEVLLTGEEPHTTPIIRVEASIAGLLRLAHAFADAHDIDAKKHGMGLSPVEFRSWVGQPRHPAGTSEGGRFAPADGGGGGGVSVGEPGSPVVPDALRNSHTGGTADSLVEKFKPKRALRSKRQQLNDLEAAYEASGMSGNKPRLVTAEELAATSGKTTNIVGTEAELEAFLTGDTHAPQIGIRGNGTLAFTGNPNRPTMGGRLDPYAAVESEHDALMALAAARRAADGVSNASSETFLHELGRGLGPDVMNRMDHGTFAALRGVQAIHAKGVYQPGLDQPYVILDRGAVITDNSRVRPTEYTPDTKSGLPIRSFAEDAKIDAAQRRSADKAETERVWREATKRGLDSIRMEFAMARFTDDEMDWIADYYAPLVMAPGATADEWVAIIDHLVGYGPASMDPLLRPLFEKACKAAGLKPYPSVAPDATVAP